MRKLAFDTETALIEPGLLAPPLTCLTYAWEDGNNGILNRHDTEDFIGEALEDDRVLLVGHNTAYDFGVVCSEYPSLIGPTFHKYREGLVQDTQLNEILLDIDANRHVSKDGKRYKWDGHRRSDYSLGGLTEYHYKVALDKTTYRLGYGSLRDTPLSEWDEGEKAYAIDDAKWTLKHLLRQSTEVTDAAAQARASWALHLLATWGVRVDPVQFHKTKDRLEDLERGLKAELLKSGYLKWAGTKRKPKLSKDMKKIQAKIVEDLGEDAPKTDKGNLKTGREVLEMCNDPALVKLSEHSHIEKLLSTYLKAMERGLEVPINARYNPILVTGRTSCSNPNMQNLPREPGIRECFIPRKGMLYCAVDYDSIELRVLAQQQLWISGHSTLAVALNDGLDPHLLMASNIMDIPYKDALERLKNKDANVKYNRQLAKIANFGYAGGLGAKRFADYAKGYGVSITDKDAQDLRDGWFKTWPEMKDYFNHINKLGGYGQGEAKPVLRISGRTRGFCSFTEAANFLFQGPTADGAKRACFEVAEKCYADPEHVLFNSRPVIFVHDELIVEVPEDKGHECGEAIAEIMCAAMSPQTPDIEITASPALAARWYKGMEPVYNKEGRLIPWTPTMK